MKYRKHNHSTLFTFAGLTPDMLSGAVHQRIRLGAINVALKSTSLCFYAKSTKNGIYRGDSQWKDNETKSKAYNQRRSPNVEYENRSSRWSEPTNRNNGAMNNRTHFNTANKNAGASKKSTEKKRKYATYGEDEEDEEDNEDENELVKLSVPDWSTIKCNKVNFNYYEPSKRTLDRCESTIDEYCEQNKIIVNDKMLAPVFHVDELTCAHHLSENLANKAKINEFSPLQSHAIPCILTGKNLIATGLIGFGR